MLKADEEQAQSLASALGISVIVSRALIIRGINTPEKAKQFFDPSLSQLHDPSLLDGIDAAVERIRRAIKRRERILVFGDYDVDGISGTALLTKALKRLGAEVCYKIPNRLREGYGIQVANIDEAKKAGISLVITVDNGINSRQEAARCGELGIDLIITDHHEPDGPLPEAIAVVDPKRPNSNYPFRDLSGVGVAFKMVQILTGEMRELDLVALGTIADISPLVGELRVLVKEGLELLNRSPSPGLGSLMEVAGIGHREINAGNVGYQLAPRLNAAGRLADGVLGVRLLLSESWRESHDIAWELDAENRRRQTIENNILEQAKERLTREEVGDPKFILLADEGWHQGVVGIVASRIVEEFHRPTILIALDGKTGKGSGRSIPGFNLHAALIQCQDLLVSFGGHELAAGLSVEAGNIPALRDRLNEIAAREIHPRLTVPSIKLDGVLGFGEITRDLINSIERMSPYGPGNLTPLFFAGAVEIYGGLRELRGGHLKTTLKKDGKHFSAVGFGKAFWRTSMERVGLVDLLYTPQINTWQDKSEIQLVLRDWRPAENPQGEFSED